MLQADRRLAVLRANLTRAKLARDATVSKTYIDALRGDTSRAAIAPRRISRVKR